METEDQSQARASDEWGGRIGGRRIGVGATAGLLLALGGLAWSTEAAAQPSIAWQTDPSVGTSEATLTLSLSCAGDAATCAFFDGYADTRVSTLVGAGSLLLDPGLGTLQFEVDSQQDLDDGLGLRDAFTTLVGSDVAFAGIPFYGVPEVVAPTFFALDDPVASLPGFDLSVPGDHPFSVAVSEAALADITGALSLQLPRIIVPAQPTMSSGTLRVLGDVDLDGKIELEVHDLALAAQVTEQISDLGVLIDVRVDASIRANLSAEIDAPGPPAPVPGLGGVACALTAGLLWQTGRRRLA